MHSDGWVDLDQVSRPTLLSEIVRREDGWHMIDRPPTARVERTDLGLMDISRIATTQPTVAAFGQAGSPRKIGTYDTR